MPKITRRLFTLLASASLRALAAPLSPAPSVPTNLPTTGFGRWDSVPLPLSSPSTAPQGYFGSATPRFPPNLPNHLRNSILNREKNDWKSFPLIPLAPHQTFATSTDPFPVSNKDRQGLLYRKGNYLRTIRRCRRHIRQSLNAYKSGQISIKEELESIAQALSFENSPEEPRPQ